ncbi:Ig-like domain-containing protein [Thermodesulfobacteriota bacterium]
MTDANRYKNFLGGGTKVFTRILAACFIVFLVLANSAMAGWSVSSVDSGLVGAVSSIGLDSTGKIHISYHDQGNNDMKYAVQDGLGGWQVSTLDCGRDLDANCTSNITTGSYNSLALDASDNVHIIFNGTFLREFPDPNSHRLYYVGSAGGGLADGIVDSSSTHSVLDNALAVDSGGNLHISYIFIDGASDKQMYYYSSASDNRTLVDTVGTNNAIAVDSGGKAHISYYDTDNYDLKYATNASGIWQAETLDSTGVVGQYTAIDVDADDNVHISYYDITNTNLKYATNAAGFWQTFYIDGGSGNVGPNSSIAVDPYGVVHISYVDRDTHALKYATNASGAWVRSSVGGSIAHSGRTSIAVGEQNDVHISHYDDNLASRGLAYARFTDDTSPTVVSTIPAGADAYPLGRPIIAAFSEVLDGTTLDNATYTLVDDVGGSVAAAVTFDYAKRQAILTPAAALQDGTQYTATIDAGVADPAGNTLGADYSWSFTASAGAFWYMNVEGNGSTVANQSASIAVDTNDSVHISCYDGVLYDLKYLTNAGGTWADIALDTTGTKGVQSDLALDSNNYLHISYYDSNGKDLKYATNASGVWALTTVDTGGSADVGQYNSIAVDGNGKVHISYYDNSADDLKYATNANPAVQPWDIQTLETSGYVGNHSAIGVDSNNRVHISYYYLSGGELKYATNASGSWQTYSLDSASTYVGYYTSLAVDANDKVHISYHDYSNSDLKYATNVSGQWTTETVDVGGIVGEYTSLAVDSSGDVHISYYDKTNRDLKYANNGSGAWDFVTVASRNNVGKYNAIALDSRGDVHIVFLDETNRDWLYATFAPPLTTAIIDGPELVTAETSASFTFVSSDPEATFECKTGWFGSFEVCESPLELTGLLEGDNSVEVRALDASGNADPTPALYEWTIDLTAPQTSINTSPRPADPTTETTAALYFFANEAATFDCRLDTGAWGACTSPASYTGLALGSHTFEVQATDAAGHVDATPASYTWQIVLNDADGDLVPDDTDNCPATPNPDQTDDDENGIGDACEGDCAAVRLQLLTDNYGSETTWELQNSVGIVVESGGPYGNAQEYTVDFCLIEGDYTFVIIDQFSDGICCTYGEGHYSLTNLDLGEEYGSGGAFTDQEATPFSITIAPTLIRLDSFTAVPRSGKVILSWTTAAEIDNSGFNIYRAEAAEGNYRRINAVLIPGQGSPVAGATYTFVDDQVKNRNEYWYLLEDLDLDGTATEHGPVSAKPRLLYGW